MIKILDLLGYKRFQHYTVNELIWKEGTDMGEGVIFKLRWLSFQIKWKFCFPSFVCTISLDKNNICCRRSRNPLWMAEIYCFNSVFVLWWVVTIPSFLLFSTDYYLNQSADWCSSLAISCYCFFFKWDVHSNSVWKGDHYQSSSSFRCHKGEHGNCILYKNQSMKSFL